MHCLGYEQSLLKDTLYAIRYTLLEKVLQRRDTQLGFAEQNKVLHCLTSPSNKVTSPKVMLEGDVTLSGNALPLLTSPSSMYGNRSKTKFLMHLK